jgi:calicheamicin 3'-O-methyl-rhamnosyltransferase
VQVFRYLSQSLILPAADVVVTHCGSGSLLGAMRHGLPVLAVPQGADQFENARQVADTGAGLALFPPELSAGALRSSASSLLGERRYRDAAEAIAREIEAMPDAA